MQHHRRADAYGNAFDRRDERRLASSKSLDECKSRKFAGPRASLEKIRNIVARREHPAGPGKHHGTDGPIAAGLPQSLGRGHIHRAVERVLFVRPAEGHAKNRAFTLDPDVWRLHQASRRVRGRYGTASLAKYGSARMNRAG